MPADDLPGQTRPIETLGAEWLLVCRGDLSEDLVYQLTKEFFTQLPALATVARRSRADRSRAGARHADSSASRCGSLLPRTRGPEVMRTEPAAAVASLDRLRAAARSVVGWMRRPLAFGGRPRHRRHGPIADRHDLRRRHVRGDDGARVVRVRGHARVAERHEPAARAPGERGAGAREGGAQRTT